MASLGGLEHLLAPWASLYNNSKALAILVTFSHFAGLLVGGGAAVTADRAAIRLPRAVQDDRERHLRELRATHRIVVAGLSVTIVSGLLMLAADAGAFLASRVFWLKMALVAALLVNGTLMLRAESRVPSSPAKGWRGLRTAATASLLLWFMVLLAGTAMAILG